MVYQRALPITSCHQPPIFPPPMVLQLMITFPRKIFPSTKLLSIKTPPPSPPSCTSWKGCPHGQTRYQTSFFFFSFRLGTSPFFFHRTANAFEWLLKNNYPFHDLKHYRDDHFMVSPSIFSVCAHNAQTITHLASQVGIPLAPNNLAGPSQHK